MVNQGISMTQDEAINILNARATIQKELVNLRKEFASMGLRESYYEDRLIEFGVFLNKTVESLFDDNTYKTKRL